MSKAASNVNVITHLAEWLRQLAASRRWAILWFGVLSSPCCTRTDLLWGSHLRDQSLYKLPIKEEPHFLLSERVRERELKAVKCLFSKHVITTITSTQQPNHHADPSWIHSTDMRIWFWPFFLNILYQFILSQVLYLIYYRIQCVVCI